MSLIEKLNSMALGGARKIIVNQIESKIKALKKEKRIVFTNTTGRVVMVDYTDKKGKKMTITVSQMAGILVNAMGESYLANVGITTDDVKEMLEKEYGGHKK